MVKHINAQYYNQIYAGILTERNEHILAEDRLIKEIDKLISN